jgi:F-type H+-transporting ATPase subunit delta
VRERIRGYADAVLEALASGPDGAQVGRLAGELHGFERILEANDDLAFVLSDPGIPAHTRRAVVDELLRSSAIPETLRLLEFAIEADRATEFPEDVSWLAGSAAAERDNLESVGRGPLGRTAAAERIDGYATAVLEAVRAEDALGTVEDELFRFGRVVDGSPELGRALTDRDLAPQMRRALVSDLLSGKAHPATVRLAAYGTQVGRARDYPEILERLVERVAEESRRQVAEVTAATELTPEQQRRLAGALAKIVGHDIDVRVGVDRRVLGGFVATIGDTVVDGSVRHRLDQLRERLVLPDANVTT